MVRFGSFRLILQWPGLESFARLGSNVRSSPVANVLPSSALSSSPKSRYLPWRTFSLRLTRPLLHKSGEYLHRLTRPVLQVSNIVYLDSPAFVGLSYSRNETDAITNDLRTAKDTHTFLLKVGLLFQLVCNSTFPSTVACRRVLIILCVCIRSL